MKLKELEELFKPDKPLRLKPKSYLGLLTMFQEELGIYFGDKAYKNFCQKINLQWDRDLAALPQETFNNIYDEIILEYKDKK